MWRGYIKTGDCRGVDRTFRSPVSESELISVDPRVGWVSEGN